MMMEIARSDRMPAGKPWMALPPSDTIAVFQAAGFLSSGETLAVAPPLLRRKPLHLKSLLT